MRDLDELYFDFSAWGVEYPVPVTHLECRRLLESCERMLSEHSATAIDLMMAHTEAELLITALQGHIDAGWVTRAAMLRCLQGLRGEEIDHLIWNPG